MKLWPTEFETMRVEARRAVDEGIARHQWPVESIDAPTPSLEQTIHLQRAAVARTYEPQREADERLLGGVWCRMFVPKGPVTAVYLHFHGGGMVLGAPEMNDPDNVALSRRFGVAVVSVDYRLAPEHSYPDALADAASVAKWLLDNAEAELGSSRLIIGGDDAGAYLAAAVMLHIRDELDAVHRVIGANLVSGVFDWGGTPSQRGQRADVGADLLTPELLRLRADAYLPGMSDEDRRDPAISPAFADLRGLCPALLSVGTCDHLLDDSLLLAGRWAAAGNPVDLVVLPEMPHGFASFDCGLTAAWSARTAAWLALLLAHGA